MANVLNPDLTNVESYINQNSTELIAKAVFSPISIKLFKVQSGVKAPTAINLLDTEVVFEDGTECGFTPTTAQTISQRFITPGFVKVNAEYCDKSFLNTFASHLVNVAAGREVLPFEEYFVKDVLDSIGVELENAIWKGDTDSAEPNLKRFDGLLKIMTADVPAENQISDNYATMLDRVWAVYNAIPAAVLSKSIIVMNVSNFRNLVKELVDANLFHYERNIDETMEIILPGTMTRVKAVYGLEGEDVVISLNPDHVVYGVDLTSDAETFRFWFSVDNKTFRLDVEFAAGVQIARPEEIIISTVAGSGNGE